MVPKIVYQRWYISSTNITMEVVCIKYQVDGKIKWHKVIKNEGNRLRSRFIGCEARVGNKSR